MYLQNYSQTRKANIPLVCKTFLGGYSKLYCLNLLSIPSVKYSQNQILFRTYLLQEAWTNNI